MKIGIGYDIHRLVEGRKLILGGAEIPYIKGLEGHSDADVLIHSICDALLGALGKGDIGEHFPDTDSSYKDISSMQLLRRVRNIAAEQGYAVGNIDSVIIAEEPKIARFRQQMVDNIADELGINKELVNIKAATNEGVGSLGKGEAIAVHSVVLMAEGS